MKETTKRTLMILLSFLLFLMAFFVYKYLIVPSYYDLNNLRGQYIYYQKQESFYNVLTEKLKDIFEQYQAREELRNQLNLILPLGIKPSYIINQLTGLAEANNLKVQSIALRESAIEPPIISGLKGLGKIKINLNLSGGYYNFKNFISMIGTNVLKMEIQAIKISPLKGTVDFKLDLITYYQS